MEHRVIGVDGCKSGWIAAEYVVDRSQLIFRTCADFSSVLVSAFEAASIAVDIPIGLTESFQPRRCDQLARRLVGPRSSSIFPAPDRRLLRFSTYFEASTFSRELSGKGLTRQSFAISTRSSKLILLWSPSFNRRFLRFIPKYVFGPRQVASRSLTQSVSRTDSKNDERYWSESSSESPFRHDPKQRSCSVVLGRMMSWMQPPPRGQHGDMPKAYVTASRNHRNLTPVGCEWKCCTKEGVPRSRLRYVPITVSPR
jgi:predicted RNase H-like nuclease